MERKQSYSSDEHIKGKEDWEDHEEYWSNEEFED